MFFPPWWSNKCSLDWDTFSFPPSLAITLWRQWKLQYKSPCQFGFSLFPSHPVAVESRCCVALWEPLTVVVFRGVIRAEAAASGLLGRSILLWRSRTRTCSKGGVVGCACRVLVTALPSRATSLSSGSVPSRGWQLWLLPASPSLCCCAQFLVHVWSLLYDFFLILP